MCKGKGLVSAASWRSRRSDLCRTGQCRTSLCRTREWSRGCPSGRGGVRPAERGFTLVELLIVIAIIGILAGLALKAISLVRQSTNVAITTTDIHSFKAAVEQYNQDEGEYPGMGKKVSGDDNQFPILYECLFGDRRPNGPGGRNAPYMDLDQDKVVVYDDDIEDYRKARRKELRNRKIEKYMLDAWGNPLVYRSNK